METRSKRAKLAALSAAPGSAAKNGSTNSSSTTFTTSDAGGVGGGGGPPRPALQQLSNLKELSSEERALDGAPQGEIFTVELLARSDLTPIESEATEKGTKAAAAAGTATTGAARAKNSAARSTVELQIIPALKETSSSSSAAAVPWNQEFDALTLLRRVVVFHTNEEGDDEGAPVLSGAVLDAVLPGVARCVRNLRSVLARNALLLCADLFASPRAFAALATLADGGGDGGGDGDRRSRPQGGSQAVEELCLALVDACAGTMPRLIRSSAADALDQLVAAVASAAKATSSSEASEASSSTSAASTSTANHNTTAAGGISHSLLRLRLLLSGSVVPAVASRSSHRNKDVAEAAMVYAEKLVAVAVAAAPAQAQAPDSSSSASSFFSSEGNPAAAAAAAVDAKAEAEAPSPSNLDLDRLLPALHHGLNGKSGATKAAARSLCRLVCKDSGGPSEFERKLAQASGLAPAQVAELQAAATQQAAARPQAASGGGRSGGKSESATAARKAMIQAMRKKKADMLLKEQNGGGGGGGAMDGMWS